MWSLSPNSSAALPKAFREATEGSVQTQPPMSENPGDSPAAPERHFWSKIFGKKHDVQTDASLHEHEATEAEHPFTDPFLLRYLSEGSVQGPRVQPPVSKLAPPGLTMTPFPPGLFEYPLVENKSLEWDVSTGVGSFQSTGEGSFQSSGCGSFQSSGVGSFQSPGVHVGEAKGAQKMNIEFKVPSKELRSSNTHAISPDLFEVPGQPLVKVKVRLVPPGRGKESFRRCKGKNLTLELKCEQGYEVARPLKFTFFIAIVRADGTREPDQKRVLIEHDFSHNPVASLPKGESGWTFDLKSNLAIDDVLVCGAHFSD
jgi:hypothetical protein